MYTESCAVSLCTQPIADECANCNQIFCLKHKSKCDTCNHHINRSAHNPETCTQLQRTPLKPGNATTTAAICKKKPRTMPTPPPKTAKTPRRSSAESRGRRSLPAAPKPCQQCHKSFTSQDLLENTCLACLCLQQAETEKQHCLCCAQNTGKAEKLFCGQARCMTLSKRKAKIKEDSPGELFIATCALKERRQFLTAEMNSLLQIPFAKRIENEHLRLNHHGLERDFYIAQFIQIELWLFSIKADEPEQQYRKIFVQTENPEEEKKNGNALTQYHGTFAKYFFNLAHCPPPITNIVAEQNRLLNEITALHPFLDSLPIPLHRLITQKAEKLLRQPLKLATTPCDELFRENHGIILACAMKLLLADTGTIEPSLVTLRFDCMKYIQTTYDEKPMSGARPLSSLRF